jgi:manganese transport protein
MDATTSAGHQPSSAARLAVPNGQLATAAPVAGLPSALDRLLAKGRIRAALTMLGPAFVASVAYVDPGNFATNIQAGAKYGYLLLWVVLAANLMAMIVQYLSAKLGVVTGRSLPELVRDRFSRPVALGMWLQAEAIAMAPRWASTCCSAFRCCRPG